MLGNRDFSNIAGLLDERLACKQSLDQSTAHGRFEHKAITLANVLNKAAAIQAEARPAVLNACPICPFVQKEGHEMGIWTVWKAQRKPAHSIPGGYESQCPNQAQFL
ncbi:hypothetical protein [Marimonas lutisalis]|uniref:hypothetical protein n=1 Tax=Marimonas lutisalis TaxID=2545756 RepID=UPI001375F9A3|nr:hypothetical protein [Marimonas lutisalis]